VSNEVSTNSLKADEVAIQFYAAHDADDIQPILRQIYDYLGVGYLTPESGNTVKADNFSIYDFQSELLAQRYIDRWAFPVDRLETFLGSVGVINLNTGKAPSANELLKLLTNIAIYSRKDDSLFILRLIDQLGMVRSKPLDLTQQDLSPSTTYLDSIQFFIALHSIFSIADAIDTSPQVEIDAGTLTSKIGRIGEIAEELGQKYGKQIGIASALYNSIQDALIALGYVITIEPTAAQTHWKHSEEEVDKEKTFKANVVWDLGKAGEKLSRWSKNVLECYTNIPDPGPQKDADVIWYPDEVLLNKNGHWEFGPNSCKTDVNGVAAVTFVPKTEKRPGEGASKGEIGTIMAQVRFRSWLDPRKMFEILTIGPENNYAIAGLTVSRHQNLSLEVSRTWAYSQLPDYIMVWEKTTIPLKNSGSGSEGEATMNYTYTHNHEYFKISGRGSWKISVKVTATLSETLHFEVTENQLQDYSETTDPDGKKSIMIKENNEIICYRYHDGLPDLMATVPMFVIKNVFDLPAHDGASYNDDRSMPYENTNDPNVSPFENHTTYKLVEE
jgi:hypothetical protein